MNAPAATADKSSDSILKETKGDPPANPDPVVPEVHMVEIPLNTSEDAVMAYLKGEIDEKVLRMVVSKYGRISYQFLTGEQMQAFNKNKFPKDLVFDPPVDLATHEDFVKSIEEKEKQREEAMRNTLKDLEDGLDDEQSRQKRALERDLEALNPKKSDKK